MAVKHFGELFYDREDSVWKMINVQPHVCIKLKSIFPKIPKTSTAPFHFDDTLENCTDLSWFIMRYPLKVSPEDFNHLIDNKQLFEQIAAEMESILLPEYVPHPISLSNGQVARDYQLKAAELHQKTKRLLLGDDLGLGKTLSAILSFLKQGTLPAVVVVQTHLTRQWKDEIEKFTNLYAHIIKGTKPYNLPVADVYIIKYSCLQGWVDMFTQNLFKSCVFDEVQELRRSGSNRYNSAKVLAEGVEYCMGMSATPVYNYGDEIFNILNLLKPGCLGPYIDFIREWGSFRGQHCIIQDPKALGTYLRDNYLFLRRTREEVGRELPPINKIVHVVGYDDNEVRRVDALASQLAMKIVSGSFMERGMAARELDLLVRQQTGVSKAREVAEYVKILVSNGEPVVLAGWHREVYSIWSEHLKEFNPVFYTGTESEAQKLKAKNDFVSGASNLFIISLRSGIGLDGLQNRCRTVVFGELDWSPQVHNQCLSEDTEILTPDGFRGGDAVNIGDIMFAFETQTGRIKRVTVNNKIDRRLAPGEEMYQVDSKRISLRVTGGHRMVVRRKQRTLTGVRRSTWEFRLAEEIAGQARRYVPTSGEESAPGVQLRDCDLRMIGWFISDGNHNKNALSFYQAAHSPWNDDLVDTLNACGLRWYLFKRHNGPGKLCNWYMIAKSERYRWKASEIEALTAAIADDAALTDVAHDIGRSKVAVEKMARKLRRGLQPKTDNIKDGIGWGYLEGYLDKNLSPMLEGVTRHQLLQLLHGLNMGDGYKASKNVYHITSINKLMLDRLQSLCIRRGLQAKINQRSNPTSAGNTVYDIIVSHTGNDAILPHRRKTNGFAPSSVGDRVWCVTNDLSTIITRRNGKIAIVGNCIGRVDRDGQKDQVTAIFLVSEYGSDPVIVDLLGLKSSQAHGIINPLTAPVQTVTDESRIKKLAETFLKKRK